MKTFFMLVLASLSVSVHAAAMSEVVGGCDQGQSYSDIVDCIKNTYARDGNTPNAASVKAFYAMLDEIKEANARGQITDAQAKGAAYRAFLNTVQAENDRQNGINRAQAQQTQSAIDAFIRNTQVQQAPQPVYTQCQRNGQWVNCTTR